MKVLSRNILATHPSYPKIIDRYNFELKEKGKVNAKKFYEEVILPEIPEYSLMSWYQFLRRLKTAYGVGPVEVVASPKVASDVVSTEQGIATVLLTNDEATRKLVQASLNISAQAAQDIIDNPGSVNADTLKRLEIGFKAMKAQDSRIHALGKIREDKREQDRFDRAFQEASFQ